MGRWNALFACLLLFGLSGCATNPVTGKNELALVSESSELDIGAKQYRPSRQMQGGDYILEPSLTEYVQQVGSRMARVSDRQLPYEFVIINDSTPNAWALPGGKIGIHRGLLVELNNEAELAAVIGHEIVHAAARHGAKGIERGMLLQGAILATGVATRNEDYSRLAVGAAGVAANLVNQGYSRDAELEADHYGMKYMARAGYDPSAAVGLQETFVRLSNDKQPNWLAGLFASHPPSRERVDQNRAHLAELGSRGELGEARYQKRVAGLKRLQPAYDAYDEGRIALSKKRFDDALGLANKAIRLEPREALFHGLKGDVLAQQGDQTAARKAYDQALHRDSGFFRHYLQRGIVRQQLGDFAGARSDLLRSIELMPTATAHHMLGKQYLEMGQRTEAVAHLRQAASSSSTEGQAASVELARLEIPDNPQRYLASRLQAGSGGRLSIVVQNRSRVDVSQVGVVVLEQAGFGRMRPVGRYRIPDEIRAGQSIVLGTELRVANSAQLRRLDSQVVSARVVR